MYILKMPIEKINSFIIHCAIEDATYYDPFIDDKDTKFTAEKNSSSIFNQKGFKLIQNLSGTMRCLLAGGEVIGFSSIFSYNTETDHICEISLLVAPEYRYHHIGSALLKHMIGAIEKNYPNAKIYLEGSNQLFAEYSGFSFSHCEHFMEKTGGYIYNLPDNMKLVHKGANLSDVTYRLYVDDISVAKCHIYDSGSHINISHVYTNKKNRGMGYAGMLINAIATLYPDKDLLLHVSGNNTAAIRAYTKIGFAIIDSTDYYILED